MKPTERRSSGFDAPWKTGSMAGFRAKEKTHHAVLPVRGSVEKGKDYPSVLKKVVRIVAFVSKLP